MMERDKFIAKAMDAMRPILDECAERISTAEAEVVRLRRDLERVKMGADEVDEAAVRAEARAEALRWKALVDQAIGELEFEVNECIRCGKTDPMTEYDIYLTLTRGRAAILADEPKEREAEGPQVDDEVFHRQMLLAFQGIRRKRRDEGMTEWADGDMAAWVMDRLPYLRSNRAEVERKLKEARP